MPLELGAVGKRVVTERAREVLLVLLVAVLDVLLEGRQALVAPVAVGAGQQLGEGIWSSRWQVCAPGWSGEGKRGRPKGQQINGSSWADCPGWYERNHCNLLPEREGRCFQSAAEAPAPMPARGRLTGPAPDPARKLIMGIAPTGDLAGWKTEKYFSQSVGGLHPGPSPLCYWPYPSYRRFPNRLSGHRRAIGRTPHL